jgi:hypothetical protein
MKTRVWCALLLALAAAGCGETKCKMDTECPLPKICVDGRCVERASDGTVDVLTDGVDPDGLDVPADGEDVNPDAEPDGAGPCTPEFADQRRTIFGGLSVSTGDEGDPDFPVLLTLSNDQVWIMGRIWSSPSATDTPKLTYVTVNPRNALPGGSWYHPLDSVNLDALHATVPLGDPVADASIAMATVFPDVNGSASNQMLYMILGAPPTAGTPVGFTGTGPYSSDPAAASAGDSFLAVWRQGNSTDSNSYINFGIVDTTGAVTASGTAAGDSTENMAEPALVHNGTGYGLVYLVHAGAGLDRTEFVELAADGTPVSGSSQSWTVEGDNTVVGRPALEWDGDRYALLWEEAAGTGAARVHLSFIEAGGTATTDSTLEDALSTTVGTVTNEQRGMMDVVWTGERYGVVWVHSDIVAGRVRVWFFELDSTGSLTDGPHLLNPDSTQTHNPTITWIEIGDGYYYVFGWNEFSSREGVHVLYTYTYGCEPEP